MIMKKLAPQIKAWIEFLPQTSLREHTLVQSFCISWFIVLAAHIKVPFYPIPMIMNDWAIMLVALVAAPRTAVGAVLFFLGYGVVGLPVLSSGVVGLSMFTGPTAGYLAGFVFMSLAITLLKSLCTASGFWVQLGVVLLGNVLLFGLGVGFLAHLMGWKMAIQTGLLPFIWMQPAKAALAAALSVYWRSWKE